VDGKTLICIVIAVMAFFLLLAYRQCRHPYLTFIVTAALGAGAHLLVFYTAPYTGINLALNSYTIICSALLSVPGVVMLLLLRHV
jgi:hypothetical protein